MPLVERRSNLHANNARTADVAAKMVEHIVPIQQEKTMAAFRVQGNAGILYTKLSAGKKCTCKSQNVEAVTLSPDGKASPGAINRILTGNHNFGISSYDPMAPLEDDFDGVELVPTSPNDSLFRWEGNNSNRVGINQIETEPTLGDNGQFSPDLENMFSDFDLSEMGISDISCPICFGSGYVGGYQAFRGFRKVLVPSDMTTDSTLMLPKLALTPGTHTVPIVFPKGVYALDVVRTMHDSKVTLSKFYVDGQDMTNRSWLPYFDGRQHTITIQTNEPLTHMEVQGPVSKEPVYFEFPKRANSADISLLEQAEPFQVLLSPDVPEINTLDVIAECQLGKLLIVQGTNDWYSKSRRMLGTEVQVRVAQPQELFHILPQRRMTGQKTTNMPTTQKPKTAGFSF